MHRFHSTFLLGAAAAALILLSACQEAANPADIQPSQEAGPAAGASLKTNAERIAQGGRKATPEEVASLLATNPALPRDPEPGSAPLAKSAAVPMSTCMVDFNSSSSLSYMYHQAYNTFTYSPHYIHSCNSTYWFYSSPINIDHFHLVPESPAYCVGKPYKIGLGTPANCRDQVDAKYWPRKATNMGSNSGVKFYPTNSNGSKRNFDLKAIYIYEGSTAEVWGYRVGIGWWVWYPLAGGGRWYFTNATNMTEMQVFDYQQNGTVVYDNIEIGIYP